MRLTRRESRKFLLILLFFGVVIIIAKQYRMSKDQAFFDLNLLQRFIQHNFSFEESLKSKMNSKKKAQNIHSLLLFKLQKICHAASITDGRYE